MLGHEPLGPRHRLLVHPVPGEEREEVRLRERVLVPREGARRLGEEAVAYLVER